MGLAVVSPPTVYPVTLAEAKDHCRVDGTADDANLTDLIKAATGHVESYCGKSFTTQGLIAYLDGFQDRIELMRGPVSAVSSITYYDEDNAPQTLDPSVYETDLFSNPATISLAYNQQWPETYQRKNAVQIAYTTAAATVPDAVKMAIKLLIGHWNDNRSDASVSAPMAMHALLANHRSYSF